MQTNTLGKSKKHAPLKKSAFHIGHKIHSAVKWDTLVSVCMPILGCVSVQNVNICSLDYFPAHSPREFRPLSVQLLTSVQRIPHF